MTYVSSFSDEAKKVIIDTNFDVLLEILYKMSDRVLCRSHLKNRVAEHKRVLEMRDHPGHEAWMEQR